MALTAAHAAFVLTGAVTTLLGPVLPWLSAKWTLSDASAGYLFAAQFAGSMAGTALSAALVRRQGFRRALALGLTLMAAGTGVLPLAGWPNALAFVSCYGVGLGITIPAMNLFVAEASGDRRGAALNILNLAWAAGAVVGPPVFAAVWASGRPDAFLTGLSAALLCVTVTLAAAGQPEPAPAASAAAPSPEQTRVRWRSPAVLFFPVLFFLYVGTENALAGWLSVHARRIEESGFAVSMPTVFWSTVLMGRGLAPVWLRRIEERSLILIGLAVAGAGTALLLRAADLSQVAMGAALAGFGLAAVFPTTIALLSREFGDANPRIAAVAFLCASLGGATVPWLVGAFSTLAGNLRVGLLVPLLGTLAMLVLHATRRRFGR